MRRWLRATAAGFVGALCFSGCSSGGTVTASEARCRRLCEDSKACLTPAQARTVNCYTSCDDLEAVNRANDCADEVDDFYDCIEKHGVCADIDTECEEQQAVYSDCLADPCSTDPDRDICL